jgi:hypothetical protein
LTKLIDGFVYERWALAWVPSLALVLLLVSSTSIRESLPLQVSSNQTAVYSTIASVGATFLGFLIAVMTLLAVLPDDRRLLHRIRRQGLLHRTVRQVARACVAMGAVTSSAIIGLLCDKPPVTAVEDGSHLAAGAYWIWTVAIAGLPAAVLLALSTATVIQMIRLSSAPED